MLAVFPPFIISFSNTAVSQPPHLKLFSGFAISITSFVYPLLRDSIWMNPLVADKTEKYINKRLLLNIGTAKYQRGIAYVSQGANCSHFFTFKNSSVNPLRNLSNR